MGLQCENANQTASALVDNIAIAPVASLEPPGCPHPPVTPPNGNFESGVLAPWSFTGNRPDYEIVSPGYKSKHALKIDMPSNLTYWTLEQQVENEFCLAYNYTVSFAINWGNYSFNPIQKGDGCAFYVDPRYCFDGLSSGSSVKAFNPPTTPNSGWQTESFTCLPTRAKHIPWLLFMECQYNGDGPVAPFTLQFDQLSVTSTPT